MSEEKVSELEKSLQLKRTSFRRFFTIAVNQFKEIHEKTRTDLDIHVQFYQVIEKAGRLFRIDEEIENCGNATAEDYESAEGYRDRLAEIKIIYQRNYKTDEDRISNSENGFREIGNLNLPKLQLKEFDLKPRSWVAFWGQFQRIHDDEGIREEDKFQYLLSSLKPGTKGRDIVDSYPPSKTNYKKVIEHLEARFGRKDLLIEVYIRDLLALVGNKSTIRLTDLYDRLGSYLRALETLGVTTSNYAAMLFPVVESCLPTDTLKAWDRCRMSKEKKISEIFTKERDLEDLMTFLRHEVECEEHRSLAEQAFGERREDDVHEPFQMDLSTASILFNNTPTNISCIFCSDSHSSEVCSKVSLMSYEDRKDVVIKRKCCLACLQPGHIARICSSDVMCFLCRRKHYAFLCPNLSGDSSRECSPAEVKQTEALFTKNESEREVYLKTIRVRLRHRDREVCVRVLLDDGSQRSYIEESLVKELGLTPTGKEVLCQGLFGGGVSPAVEHKIYTVTVESMDHKYSIPLSLLDQTKICSALPRISDGRVLQELVSKGIDLTDFGDGMPPIRMLLGADLIGSILTGRIEVLKSGLLAVHTELGWAIMGLGKRKHVANMVSLALQCSDLSTRRFEHFGKTQRIREDRRQGIPFPLLAGHPPLFSKCDVGENGLRKVTRRFVNEKNFQAPNSSPLHSRLKRVRIKDLSGDCN